MKIIRNEYFNMVRFDPPDQFAWQKGITGTGRMIFQALEERYFRLQ